MFTIFNTGNLHLTVCFCISFFVHKFTTFFCNTNIGLGLVQLYGLNISLYSIIIHVTRCITQWVKCHHIYVHIVSTCKLKYRPWYVSIFNHLSVYHHYIMNESKMFEIVKPTRVCVTSVIESYKCGFRLQERNTQAMYSIKQNNQVCVTSGKRDDLDNTLILFYSIRSILLLSGAIHSNTDPTKRDLIKGIFLTLNIPSLSWYNKEMNTNGNKYGRHKRKYHRPVERYLVEM